MKGGKGTMAATVSTRPKYPGTREGGAGDEADDLKPTFVPERRLWHLTFLLHDSCITTNYSSALVWNDLTPFSHAPITNLAAASRPDLGNRMDVVVPGVRGWMNSL